MTEILPDPSDLYRRSVLMLRLEQHCLCPSKVRIEAAVKPVECYLRVLAYFAAHDVNIWIRRPKYVWKYAWWRQLLLPAVPVGQWLYVSIRPGHGGNMTMSSDEVIAVYETMSTLTRQMLMAARSRDWDTLRRLEQACADQVKVLKHGHPVPALPAELRTRKVRLLQAILADDREIRTITEPSLQQLSLIMQGSALHLAPRNCCNSQIG